MSNLRVLICIDGSEQAKQAFLCESVTIYSIKYHVQQIIIKS